MGKKIVVSCVGTRAGNLPTIFNIYKLTTYKDIRRVIVGIDDGHDKTIALRKQNLSTRGPPKMVVRVLGQPCLLVK